MAVHNNRVLWVHIEAGHTAHHVGWKLGGELVPVDKAPQNLGLSAVIGEADDAQ